MGSSTGAGTAGSLDGAGGGVGATGAGVRGLAGDGARGGDGFLGLALRMVGTGADDASRPGTLRITRTRRSALPVAICAAGVARIVSDGETGGFTTGTDAGAGAGRAAVSSGASEAGRRALVMPIARTASSVTDAATVPAMA